MSALKPIIITALAGGAAYFFWKNSSASGAGGSGFTLDDIKKLIADATKTPGAPAGSGAAITDLLQAAAGAAVQKLNADQWNYYLAGLANRTAISASDFARFFFPSGDRPAEMPLLTAAEFVTAAGLRGLGNLRAWRNAPEAAPKVIVLPAWLSLAAHKHRRAAA